MGAPVLTILVILELEKCNSCWIQALIFKGIFESWFTLEREENFGMFMSTKPHLHLHLGETRTAHTYRNCLTESVFSEKSLVKLVELWYLHKTNNFAWKPIEFEEMKMSVKHFWDQTDFYQLFSIEIERWNDLLCKDANFLSKDFYRCRWQGLFFLPK